MRTTTDHAAARDARQHRAMLARRADRATARAIRSQLTGPAALVAAAWIGSAR